MFRSLTVLLVLSSLLVSSGCKTTSVEEPIIEDTNEYAIKIVTEPLDGVSIYTNKGYKGSSPLMLYLEADKEDIVIYKDGYTPVSMELNRTKNQEILVKLQKTNPYLFELVKKSNIRFAKRTNLDRITIEPSNRPISKNSSFYLEDVNRDVKIKFIVTDISDRFLTLETDEGMTVHYPIVHIYDDRKI